MFMNWTMRLSARATPGIPRTRRTFVSGKVCAKSTLGVSFDVTQTSAAECSIVTVALARRPMKRPTWTRTSVTAKATPDTVITNRSRSCRRFLRARETMASPLRRRLQEAAEAVLDHGVHEVLGRRALRPVFGLEGDEEGDRAVHAGPEDLGHLVRVAGTEAPERDRLLDRGLEDGERLLAGVRRLGYLLVLGPGHEHEAVVVRVFDREARVGAAELAGPVRGVVRGELALEDGEEVREVLLAERVDEVVLVLEVVVNGGRRVLDGFRDPAHRDLLVPLGGEEIAGRVHDLPPHLFALS